MSPQGSKIVDAPTSTDTTILTTSETVVATLSNVGTGVGRSRVRLRGWVQLLSGATTSAVTIRIRRTTVTGTLVGEANAITLPSAAGGTDEYSIETADVPGDGTFTYVLTVQQTGATANGTAVQADLTATIS